jgi:hypothetical protein
MDSSKAAPELKRVLSGMGDGSKPPPTLSRRASFSARTMPTFKFSAALEQATKQEEEAYNFEQWRLQMKKVFVHSRFGRYYENIVTLVSLVSCFEYIYETYLHESVPEDRDQLRVLKDIELAFACLFGLDWILSFLMAEHRTLYFMRYVHLSLSLRRSPSENLFASL